MNKRVEEQHDTIVAELRSLLARAERGEISGFMWLVTQGSSYDFGFLKMNEITRLRASAVLSSLSVKAAFDDDNGVGL